MKLGPVLQQRFYKKWIILLLLLLLLSHHWFGAFQFWELTHQDEIALERRTWLPGIGRLVRWDDLIRERRLGFQESLLISSGVVEVNVPLDMAMGQGGITTEHLEVLTRLVLRELILSILRHWRKTVDSKFLGGSCCLSIMMSTY